jgi:chondroitin AC lyase
MKIVYLGLVNAEISIAGNNPDLELLRKRVIGELLMQKVDEQQVRGLIPTIRENGSWPGINCEDVSRIGYEHTRCVRKF